MKYKIVKVGKENLLDFFKEGEHRAYKIISGAIPRNSKIINVKLGFGNHIELLVESKEFDEVKEGTEIPVHEDIVAEDI